MLLGGELGVVGGGRSQKVFAALMLGDVWLCRDDDIVGSKSSILMQQKEA